MNLMIALLALAAAPRAPKFEAYMVTPDLVHHPIHVGAVALPERISQHGWDCRLKPVMSDDGVQFTQGLLCSMDDWHTAPGVFASCSPARTVDDKSMTLGDSLGVVELHVKCVSP